jgi:hypothetical protein
MPSTTALAALVARVPRIAPGAFILALVQAALSAAVATIDFPFEAIGRIVHEPRGAVREFVVGRTREVLHDAAQAIHGALELTAAGRRRPGATGVIRVVTPAHRSPLAYSLA